MLVKKYLAEVVGITNPVDSLYLLLLRSKGKPFNFMPGQFLHLALDEYDPSQGWPESRCFSMQSSPSEELIKITYSVKGNFTNRMKNELKPGSEITLKLPYGGLFAQPHDKSNSVFIAGGTGITPFLSLFTHESFNGYTNPHIYLGFRSKEHNIYHDELNRSYNPSKFVKLVYENLHGILDIQSIYSENGPNSDYFISGPPAMIKDFKQTLIAKGVRANRVLTDDWE